jgi:hypothetical protein
MKPCHAAALAVVGWYLMVPLRDNGKIRVDVPISGWAHLDSFESAAECRKAGYEHQAEQKAKGTPNPGDWECIATDDPRLKETH